jgi:hypothetical protein
VTLLRTAVFTIGFACLAAGTAAAQFDDELAKVVVGPMAGVSFSTLRGAGVGDADIRAGLVAGGFVTVGITPFFAIEPQVFYIQKGANYHADSSGVELSTAYALTYLEIPLLFKARYPITEGRWPLIVSAIAGPSIGLNVRCDYIDNDNVSTRCGERHAGPNVSDPPANGLDFSAAFGVGFDFFHFAFQARYDYSFSYTFQGYNPAFPTSTADIHNQAWVLSLGYKFAMN